MDLQAGFARSPNTRWRIGGSAFSTSSNIFFGNDCTRTSAGNACRGRSAAAPSRCTRSENERCRIADRLGLDEWPAAQPQATPPSHRCRFRIVVWSCRASPVFDGPSLRSQTSCLDHRRPATPSEPKACSAWIARRPIGDPNQGRNPAPGGGFSSRRELKIDENLRKLPFRWRSCQIRIEPSAHAPV